MAGRDHYLPRASVLDKMPEGNRVAVLEYHRLWIERDLEYLKAGDVLITDHRSTGYHRSLLLAKKRRLVSLAQSYGYWLSDEQAAMMSEPAFGEF